jgi:hypothetical protein
VRLFISAAFAKFREDVLAARRQGAPLETGSALMLERRERGLATMVFLAVLAACAIMSGAARADDSAPPAAPPDEGIVQGLARKIEGAGVARNPYVHPLARAMGIATDPGAPADFVVKSRPAAEQDYIPVGRKETEHSIKPKTAVELKAMEAEFDQVKTHHDALRSTFAPAVKAVADAKAAQAAKAAKPKKTAPPPAGAQ